MPHRSGHEDLFEGFAAPQAAFSPAPIWWWSGERIELDRLRWQLDQLVEQGVHNLVVLNLAPTGPTYGSLADDPPMFSEEWWALWEGLCDHAGDRGALLWFYDQIGFSGANLQGQLVTSRPEFAGASLERVVKDVDGGCELVCPAAGTPIAACALPLSAEGVVDGPPVPLEIVDGRVHWDGGSEGGPVRGPESGPESEAHAGRHRVMLAYSLRQGFDYTSAAACAALLDVVHGEFERRLGKYLGTVIVGSFQDELPNLPTWSPAYPDHFARHTGYRIEDVIAALWDDLPSLPGGAEPARVRADYQRVRAALAEDAFFKPLHAWHERHGLTVGVDQQSPSRAGEPLGCTRQYADYARTHRWFSAPGSDHHGEAKIHSSLAHHYDRPRTWIESFHSSGWGGTLEETFDWLVPWLLAGATLYNPHAVYYSTRGGWWEWAPPSTCWRQPYWPHYKQFADTVSRLCWLLTRGEHVCDVGVLYPSATVQAGTLVKGALPAGERAHRAYLDVVGRMVWYDAKPGVLNRAHRDFDVLDDDTVASADVRAGALHTGGESYRAVVLPACAVLEGPTARTLAEFCRAGGLLVVVGDRPTLATGQDGDDAVRALRGLLDDGSAVAVDDVDELPAVLERLGRTVDSGGPVLHRRVGPLNVLVVPAAPEGTATAQPMLRKGANWFAGPREHGYDFDAARFREEAVVSVPPSAAAVEQWDPLAGTARPAVTRRVGDRLDVTVTFDQVPAAVLVWKDPATGDGETGTRGAGATGAEPRGAARTGATQTGATQTGAAYTGATQKGADHSTGDRPAVDPGVDLDAGWTVSVAPTLDNRYGDLALPASDGAFPLQQWRLRHRVETGAVDGRWAQPDLDDSDWTDVLVGQGLFGWHSRPLAATDVPEPLPAGYDGPLDGSHDRPGHGEGEGHAEGAAPPDAPNAPGWQPVRYSLSRGIEKDPFQARMLGPKGRVPDDFWHVEGVRAGQLVVLRTALPVDVEQDLTLAVGTNGAAEVWWNGVPLGPDPGGYLRLDPVRARADTNLLEVRVTADVNGALRGYWALSTDAAAFVRPAWLVPADGSARGTALVARGRVDLPAAPARAVLQLGTDGPARLVVNGQEIATQGAFEPYGTQNRVLPYDVTAHLVPGENQIEVRFTDIGRPLAVFADALVEYPDGATATFVTDGSWTFARDGAPVPTALRRTHPYDPRWSLLRPRPHPLPRAAWLEPETADGTVLDTVPDARPGQPRPAEWFRLVVPPGASAATLPVTAGRVQAFVDGAEVPVEQGKVGLPGPGVERRTLAVRVVPVDGREGGALWDGPLTFDCVEGPLGVGPWSDGGLGSYSGGLRYRRQVQVDQVAGGVVLDLGTVRGTAEVTVNGTPVGVRVWSPYRFDLTDAVREGTNEIEVLVYNTLAPYLDDCSPTLAVFHGQRLSGLLGPVRLRTGS